MNLDSRERSPDGDDRYLRPGARGTQPGPAAAAGGLFELDLALREALTARVRGGASTRSRDAGAVAGSVEAHEHGRRAERNEPILRTHDRFGNRIDEVELDPSWHWLLRGAIEREIHSCHGESESGRARGPRGAVSLWGNANGGVLCPVSMTYAAIPALRDSAPELDAEWEPRLTKPDYDHGALAGMAMTERQGGSDVRANITRAEPIETGRTRSTATSGSAPTRRAMCSWCSPKRPAGLSCFLVERAPVGWSSSA